MFRHGRSLRAMEAKRQATARAMDLAAAARQRQLLDELNPIAPQRDEAELGKDPESFTLAFSGRR